MLVKLLKGFALNLVTGVKEGLRPVRNRGDIEMSLLAGAINLSRFVTVNHFHPSLIFTAKPGAAYGALL